MARNAKSTAKPLEDIRVTSIGSGWAGRVASMLLADQGADVIEIVQPVRAPQPCDPLLDRGKRLLEADLKKAAGRARVRELLDSSDVVFENMRGGAAARLGVDYASLKNHDRLIYVSLPGFAHGDACHTDPAWEGMIDAASGVYTDIAPLVALIGGDPVYSAIPMASAYGGVLGAAAASMALFDRQRSARAQRIEVPLADAVLSAMALLIMRIEGQPPRYNFPPVDDSMMHTAFPILRDVREHLDEHHLVAIKAYLKSRAMPTLYFYPCADERLLFVCAMDHAYQTRALLETVGIYDKIIAEGMTASSPYDASAQGNNIYNGGELSAHWRSRMIELISGSVRTRPGKEWETLLREANVPATVVQTDREWLADPQLLAAGVTAELADAQYGNVRMPGQFVSIESATGRTAQLRPGTKVENAQWLKPAVKLAAARPGKSLQQGGLLQGIRVLDLSNVVAGPACGRTLAEHGADVIRIDPPSPLAGPRNTMWFGVEVNQGKRATIIDLKTEAGKSVLASLVKRSDVVLHNFLDRSARNLGIDHEQLAAINPNIITCQISAWGGSKGGAYKDDPAFDPVLQAASGIMARFGQPNQPVIHGIASCVDYMTGFCAVLGISQALLARQRGHGGAMVRTSLAMGAQLVQFPFMAQHAKSEQTVASGQCARGEGCEQTLYQLAEGWAFVGCRRGDGAKLAQAVGAADASTQAISEKLKTLTLDELRQRLVAVPGAGAQPAQTLAQLRERHTVDGALEGGDTMPAHSFRLRRSQHPCGYPVTLPLATWIRPESAKVHALDAAPLPGQHTTAVLAEAGYDEKQIAALIEAGTVHSRWQLLDEYLPH